jgi:hypothetical protein
MTEDPGREARIGVFRPDRTEESSPSGGEPSDPALIEASNALRAARSLPLVDQPAALEAVHAALSARLGDVQNA